MSAKRVKIKVKKKKVNTKRIFITILIIILLCLFVAYILKLPIKNIYITGNNLVSDKEIIALAELEDYPSFLSTFFDNIDKKILQNDYIKEVKVTRQIFNKISINIEEYKPICIYNDKLLLSSSKTVDNIYNIDYIPYLVNDINDIYDEFIKQFSNVNDNILLKISHIEYAPNDVDKERFLLYMVDQNYVYITLPKITKINKYNSIVKELEGKKGIIYLDSGDYVEIKKNNKEENQEVNPNEN